MKKELSVPLKEIYDKYAKARITAANCMDFAKKGETEINRVNDMIAKRGKKTSE